MARQAWEYLSTRLRGFPSAVPAEFPEGQETLAEKQWHEAESYNRRHSDCAGRTSCMTPASGSI
jgi:hypothetical protein